MARHNIGVAIEIPEPFGGQLREARERFSYPHANTIPPHITLLPPTAVADDKLAEVHEHLTGVALTEHPFELVLRGSGTFRPVSPVTFVMLAAGISACERLEAKVRSGPLARDLRFYYHPHVTVAHDVDDSMLEAAFEQMSSFAARFVAAGCTLFEQAADRVWRPLTHFPFRDAVG